MAKGDAQFRKWAEEFKAKLPENLRNSWSAVVDNEYEGREELMNAYLRQDDYTRKTQELAEARRLMDTQIQAAREQAAAARDAEYQNWYQKANEDYVQMQKKQEALEKALAETGFRPTPSNPEPANPTMEQNDLLEKLKLMEARIAAVDRGTYNSVISLNTLAYRAAKENLPYDPAKIVEISTKNQMPIDRAFEEFVKPELEKRQKEALEKQLEEAREAGRREALSSRGTPDSMGHGTPPVSSAVLDKLFSNTSGSGTPTPTTRKRDSELIQEAIKGFYEESGGA